MQSLIFVNAIFTTPMTQAYKLFGPRTSAPWEKKKNKNTTKFLVTFEALHFSEILIFIVTDEQSANPYTDYAHYNWPNSTIVLFGNGCFLLFHIKLVPCGNKTYP